MPVPQQSGPSRNQLLAEAYRRGMFAPARAAAYEEAALHGLIDDPYAAARANEKLGGWNAGTGAGETLSASVPGVQEFKAAARAGTGALGDMFGGRPADFGGKWNRVRAEQQGYQDQFAADHPIATVGLRTAGLAAQILPFIASGGASEGPTIVNAFRSNLAAGAKRLATRMVRGATTGGVGASITAAGQPGTLQQRARAATNAFSGGAALGAVLPPIEEGGAKILGDVVKAATGAPETLETANAMTPEKTPLTPAPSSNGPAPLAEDVESPASGANVISLADAKAQRPIQVAPTNKQATILSFPGGGTGDATIPLFDPHSPGAPMAHADAVAALMNDHIRLTPGQIEGGAALAAEDQAMLRPSAGKAIRTARLMAQGDLSRALAARALEPLGEKLPANIKLGQGLTDYLQKTYDQTEVPARGLHNVLPDGEFYQNNASIVNNSLSSLPRRDYQNLDNVAHNVAVGLMNNKNGDNEVNALQDYLDYIITGYKYTDVPSDNYMTKQLYNLKDSLNMLSARHNPTYWTIAKAIKLGGPNAELLKSANSYAQTRYGGFSPENLAQAYADHMADPNSDLAERGGQPMFDLVQNAKNVMGSDIPAALLPKISTYRFGDKDVPYTPNPLSISPEPNTPNTPNTLDTSLAERRAALRPDAPPPQVPNGPATE